MNAEDGSSLAVNLKQPRLRVRTEVDQGRVAFHRPWLGREEELAVVGALKTRVLEGNGPIGRAVEARLCEVLGVRHALLMSSCTAALECALEALGVAHGEVILPSFSFPSTAAAVIRAGARPVFADIDPNALTLDPERVREALSPATRAILYVDYGGFPGAIDAIRDLAQQAGVPLLEDAAHALGSRVQDRALGTWGVIGCFSFHQTKIVSCGEGGLLVTDNDRLAEAARVWREYGTNRAAFFRGLVDHYEWVGGGTSALLAEPLAAVVGAQLHKLPEIVRRQRVLAQRYLQALTPLAQEGGVRLPVEAPHARCNWHTFPVLARDGRQAAGLIAALAERGIDVRRHFYPLHLSAYAARYGYAKGDLPVTESVAERLVRLPIYPTLTNAQQEQVIDGVCRGLRSGSSCGTL